MTTEYTTIKIPPQVYVGFQGRRSEDDVPLGFLTPYTLDAAGVKRRSTVDSWASSGHHYRQDRKKFNSVILDNNPMIGFKIGRGIRRSGGWNGSGASYVRIEDPRGFELEITIENLVMCMSDNLLHDGEIIQQCVWGRDGNRNILLPINSKPYIDSIATTKKLASVIPLRDVKPGDEITLVTGEKGIYLGGLHEVIVETDHHDYQSTRTTRKVSVADKKKYVLREVNAEGNVTFTSRSTLKVTSIDKEIATRLTPLAIEQMIANEVKAELAKGRTTECVLGYSTKNYSSILGWVSSSKVTLSSNEVVLSGPEAVDFQNQHAGVAICFQAVSNLGKTLISGSPNFANDKVTYVGSPQQSNYYAYGHQYGYMSQRAHISTKGFVGFVFMGRNQHELEWISSEQQHIEPDDIKNYAALVVKVTSQAGVEHEVVL